MQEMKICKKCQRELPMNTDYYFKKCDQLDGYSKKCKECSGHSFTKKLKSKEGFKFCIKCDREFEISLKYFPPDKACKDGFRNVCRECGNDRHFMEDDYTGKHFWTQEELDLLKELYPHYLNEEIIEKYFPNETLKGLQDRAWEMGVKKTDNTMQRKHSLHSERMSGKNCPSYGRVWSEESKRKLSLAKKGKYIGINNKLYGVKWDKNDYRRNLISKRKKGIWSGENNPRHLNPLNGELNGRWDGGIKELYYDLRDHLQEWKRKSMEDCNYKCVVTGLEFDEIHHIINFKLIVNEVFEILELPKLKTIGEYSELERNNIYKVLNELHIKYGNGKCLCKPIHKIFHDFYNYSNNTYEQFEEFTQRYYNFEFDDLLESKYKYTNVRNLIAEVG